MRKKSALVIAILLFSNLFCITRGLFALDPAKAMTQYTMDQWSDERGLPQNSVYAVLQTRDGYLWLGTEEGLARFDGVVFKVFDEDNTPAIKSNHIKCLYEDSRGYLWIGTLEGGAVCYRDREFTRFTGLEKLDSNSIYAIHGDKDGLIWLGTDSKGVFRFDPVQNTMTAYAKKDGLPSDGIKSILTDSKGNTWLGTMAGLCLVKDKGFTVYQVGGAKDESEVINTLYEDSKKNLWIGTIGNLYRMEGTSFVRYALDPDVAEVEVSGITEDRHHNLWITTKQSGLVRFNNGSFDRLGKGDGFADNWLLSLIEDTEGSLWVGTSYGGVYRLKDEKFSTITTKEGLADDVAWSVYEDSKGYLWFGTNGGLTRYKDGQFKVLTTRNGLSHNTVDTLMEDSKGNLWVGTDAGLNRLPNPESNRFRTGRYLRDLRQHYIPSILEDREGQLWVGTLQGAFKIQGNNIEAYTNENGLATKYVNFVHQDGRGNFWFSTLSGGLTKLTGDQFTVYTKEHGLAANSFNCIYEDREGVMWFGSKNGLSRFKDGAFATITKKNGLFNNNIYQFLEDNSGHMWMSGNKGIFKVRKRDLHAVADGKLEKLKSVAYGKADGLRSIECNGGYQSAGFKSRDGRLWFPTAKGIVMIDPERILTNKVRPPVHIEHILLDGQGVDLGKPIEVQPGVKRLEIRYTALSFLHPDKVKFKYKLEGYDEEWLDVGNRRTAWYTNLDGGDYEFKVIACNNDEVWNPIGAAVGITVIPPFWLTWWFIAIALTVFAFFSYVVIHFFRKYISLSSFWKKEKHVGKFKLMDKIGSGGMGTVYKATNLMDKSETVALKILREDLFEDENNRKRFKQEAAIIDQLDHPNIVKVFERGQSGQNMFIAMELLEGGTLADKIMKEKQLKLDESLHIMLQTSSALAKIHSKKIIHRDMKPDNIMLIHRDGDPNFVKLLDFGLAKMQNQTRLTQTGIVIGTINYMAPEQISGKGSFIASDIYSLGVIFYEMVTGEKPFLGETTIDIMKQILDKSAIEPSRFRDDIPFDLNYLIMNMLFKEQEGRPAIGDVRERLKLVQMNLQSVTSQIRTT
jgi:ligand-binding sensor domain-containing protein/tRNA A-37 threonylcarbamoyl transferase component Bud32